ncbi:Calcineurin-like phosphoesterase [Cryobacterium flavum]|uniref:Calcineurin-like phosphoesterase n=2 Tax=Cryobacterium flavum TaxID=1424659 RepID=A0A4R8V1J1_9MICO|nr:metallophosphoesterase [Cryobacterium flavum]SDO00969.1 Calcineurin-like phosphoesterase [Cryobacterium flavum]
MRGNPTTPSRLPACHPDRAGAAHDGVMTTNETVDDLSLPGESVVAMAGDWHADSRWCGQVIPFIARKVPGVRTILHAGDFGFWPPLRGKSFLGTVDYWSARANISRVLVTPGNHEQWANLNAEFAKNPNQIVQMSEVVWVMPRGFRFTLAGRSFMSFGGGASLDFQDRVPEVSWFYDEMASDAEVDQAIAGGPVDVLLTHETIDGGTPLVERIIGANPMGWNATELAYSAVSRRRITRLYEAVKPEVLVHGHIHVKDETVTATGTRIYSLACDWEQGNAASFDLESGAWQWLGDPRRR